MIQALCPIQLHSKRWELECLLRASSFPDKVVSEEEPIMGGLNFDLLFFAYQSISCVMHRQRYG
jgi:hypothetical protein